MIYLFSTWMMNRQMVLEDDEKKEQVNKRMTNGVADEGVVEWIYECMINGENEQTFR